MGLDGEVRVGLCWGGGCVSLGIGEGFYVVELLKGWYGFVVVPGIC